MDESTLYDIVCKARHVFDEHADELCNDNGKLFNEFPLGTCDYTSSLLGQYLFNHHGLIGIRAVKGCTDTDTDYGRGHVWLELDGLIIDITADQFDDFSQKVYIDKDRSFHSQFEGQKDFSFYSTAFFGKAYYTFFSYMESDK